MVISTPNARANFHTTSIYSGLLRMADLMALQPNLDIRAHIVAHDETKDKVIQEISRPLLILTMPGTCGGNRIDIYPNLHMYDIPIISY